MNDDVIVIEFPLRGEWSTKLSPASHLPSHGTNRFGLRYAIDFVKINLNDPKHLTHNKKQLDYFLKGIPLESYYCFKEDVYAPFSGEIVAIENNVQDGYKASWFHDQIFAIRNALFFNPKRDAFSSIGGNYVILKKDKQIYAIFCHLYKDSISVSLGDFIEKGQLLGKVGHSGNSTEPHLHFHLMDSLNIETATGIPFIFEEYEIFDGINWNKVKNQLPSTQDYIRFFK